MTNQIIDLQKGSTTESLMLNENCFWYSSRKHDSVEKMRKTVEKKDGGMLDYHGIVDYDKISKLIMNEKSTNLEVFYTSKKGKDKSIELEFDSISQAHEIGEAISSKTDLKKNVTIENRTQRLLMNLVYLIITIGATLFIGLIGDFEVSETPLSKGARRVQSAKIILRFIHEYIGQTGIFIIGGLISALLIYRAFKRYNNPVNDIIYE